MRWRFMWVLASSQSEASELRGAIHEDQDTGDEATTGPCGLAGCTDDPAAGWDDHLSALAVHGIHYLLILDLGVHCFFSCLLFLWSPLPFPFLDPGLGSKDTAAAAAAAACSCCLRSPFSNKNCTTVACIIWKATKKMHSSIHTSISWQSGWEGQRHYLSRDSSFIPHLIRPAVTGRRSISRETCHVLRTTWRTGRENLATFYSRWCSWSEAVRSSHYQTESRLLARP